MIKRIRTIYTVVAFFCCIPFRQIRVREMGERQDREREVERMDGLIRIKRTDNSIMSFSRGIGVFVS